MPTYNPLTCSTPMCATPAETTGADGKRYCYACLIDCAPREFPENRPPRRCADCGCGPERLTKGEHGIDIATSNRLVEVGDGELLCASCNREREEIDGIRQPGPSDDAIDHAEHLAEVAQSSPSRVHPIFAAVLDNFARVKR